MAQQGTPNLIEAYEAAVLSMAPIIAGIKPGQLTDATPCSEWNVQALLNHNIKVAQFVHALLAGAPDANVMSSMEVSGPLPPEGAADAFVAGTSSVLEDLKASGALERMVTPFGDPLPVGHFLVFPLSDIVIHKWDLAKATNQDTSIDSGLAEVTYQGLSQAIEAARQMGAFGPEVQVPITGSIQDRLLGMSGRKP